MKKSIQFITIAILVSISFLAANAQESAVASVNETLPSTGKVEKKETAKKQSSKDDDSWTGFYVGGFSGFTNGRANPRLSTVPIASDVTNGLFQFQEDVDEINKGGNQKINSNGVNGGGTFGYNRQQGKFVVGGEVDFGINKLNKSIAKTAPLRPLFPDSFVFTVTQTVKSDWMLTARPRAGVALKKALLYVTAGLALTNVKYDGKFFERVRTINENGSFSKTATGWTAGVGTEFKVTKHLSVKSEYLFSQFGRTTITSTNATRIFNVGLESRPGQVFTHSTDLKSHSVRFGVNYRF